MDTIVRITDEKGDYIDTSIESFLEENADSEPETSLIVERVLAGKTVSIGGGAMPFLKLELVTD